MSDNPLLGLKSRGQSVWLDDLHRRMFNDGSLARLISADGLAGMTSNPAIFAKAIMKDQEYAPALTQLLPRIHGGGQLYEALALDDIRQAAQRFRPVYEGADGRDGFVSLEVSPHLAHDTQATISEAHRLWERLGCANVMIKVPGTEAGLQAIRELTAAGINVNITLLFSPARYRAVAEAYLAGLEERARRSQDVHGVASVASFFLSRIDTLVDRRLDALAQQGREPARALRGRAAIACACQAYEIYVESTGSARWQALARQGARTQRLLWASTSTKDERYSDIKYVEELIAADTVNTVPQKTLAAYRDHGRPGESRGLDGHRGGAREVVDELARLGIDLEEVAGQLEAEGVRKFIEPFDELQNWLQQQRK